MNIVHRISVDFAVQQNPHQISLMQNDSARTVEAKLYENGAIWDVPDDAVAYIAFRKPTGEKVKLTTLFDGSPAVVCSENVATISVSQELTGVVGSVPVIVVFVGSDEKQIATFPILINVLENPATESDESAKVTPGEFEQLMAYFGLLQDRVDELIAMKSATGKTIYEIHFAVLSLEGRVYSNGASAYIEVKKNHNPDHTGLIGTGSGIYEPNCIPPEFVPMLLSTKGNIELETDNPALTATMSLDSKTGYGNLRFTNVSSEPFTKDMKATFTLSYPLASVSIAELADARIDYKGNANSTAGNAIRSQVSGVRNESAPVIINTKIANYFETKDAANDRQIENLRVFGKTSTKKGGIDYNAPPKPTSPVRLSSPESLQVHIAQFNTGDLVVKEPFATFDHQMAGIPMQDVCTKQNYTDAKGQKWFTDEIDFARGVYIQRCFMLTFDGTEGWYTSSDGKRMCIAENSVVELSKMDTGTSAPDNGYCAYHMCSHFKSATYAEFLTTANQDGLVSSTGTSKGVGLLFGASSYAGDVDGWKKWLASQAAAGTPVTMVLGRRKPEEILFTHKQLPSIGSNWYIDNMAGFDGGKLDMELCYAADTKKYIDQKLAEISSAILNN